MRMLPPYPSVVAAAAAPAAAVVPADVAPVAALTAPAAAIATALFFIIGCLLFDNKASSVAATPCC